MTAAELKSRFKSHRATVPAGEDVDNWAIRLHRAISWLARADKLAENDDLAEARLLYYWISFNSLYATWDAERNAPCIDSQRMHQFIPLLFQIGGGGELPGLLETMRPAVKRLLQNRFLSSIFWRNPATPDRDALQGDLRRMDGHYRAREHAQVLRLVLDRIYVLRGQIVHGASTSGSNLNRNALKDCTVVLKRLVPVVIELVIERGLVMEWPPLCYPPIRN